MKLLIKTGENKMSGRRVRGVMKEEEEKEESKRENEKSVFSPSKTHQLRKEVPS